MILQEMKCTDKVDFLLLQKNEVNYEKTRPYLTKL